MSSRAVTLATAAFLDSPQAAALLGVDVAQRRTIVERFLDCAHNDLGREPAELDGEGLRDLLGKALPSRFRPQDPLAGHVPAVIEAFLLHLGETAVVNHAFEQSMALDDGLAAFAQAVEAGDTPRRASTREARPFIHGASKTGRNDPCPCGSGKKFKQCHGKKS